MNIFFLDRDPYKAATYVHDVHCRSQINESSQMLSAWAHNYSDYPQWYEYLEKTEWTKLTHVNHPCVKWLLHKPGNALWLAQHLEGLLHQYDIRYPGSKDKYVKARQIWPAVKDYMCRFVIVYMDAPPQCMPEQYQVPGGTQAAAVEAYRNYYIGEKLAGNTYKTKEPDWIRKEPKVEKKKLSAAGLSLKKKEPETSDVDEKLVKSAEHPTEDEYIKAVDTINALDRERFQVYIEVFSNIISVVKK